MKNLQKQKIILTSEFIEECQAIIIEAVFTSRWALVEGYWHLGKRIREEAKEFSITDFTARVAVALGKSERLIWYAVQFYDKYPVLDSVPEGKNISWTKLITKYLPIPKDQNFVFNPKVYNIWNFAGRNSEFGMEYPGNIPGEIALNVIYYYTDEGDLVVDPMAGGGSTIDACSFLKRRCFAYDISPARKDISYNDVTKGFPDEAIGCKLIFLDPPYFKLKAKDYGKLSVSELEYNQFQKFVQKLAEDCFKATSDYVSYIIQNYYPKFGSLDNYIDFGVEAVRSFEQAGFRLVNRISCPQTSQVYSPSDVELVKKQKGMLNLMRDLIIFKKL